MLPEFFQSARRVRDLRVGPAGPLVTSFADKLRQDGYAELTARRHLRSAERLGHWAIRHSRRGAEGARLRACSKEQQRADADGRESPPRQNAVRIAHMARHTRVVTWNGRDVPPELRELRAGRCAQHFTKHKVPPVRC
jgi:hypothetical protein